MPLQPRHNIKHKHLLDNQQTLQADDAREGSLLGEIQGENKCNKERK